MSFKSHIYPNRNAEIYTCRNHRGILHPAFYRCLQDDHGLIFFKPVQTEFKWMLIVEHFDSPVAIDMVSCRLNLDVKLLNNPSLQMLWWSASIRNPRSSPSPHLTSELWLPAAGEYLAPIFQRAQWSQLLIARYFPLGLEWTLLIYFIAKTHHRETFHEQKITNFIKSRISLEWCSLWHSPAGLEWSGVLK